MRSGNRSIAAGLGLPMALIVFAITVIIASGCGTDGGGDNVASGGDSPADTEHGDVDLFELLGWDDPSAQWRTFHATVQTLTLISGNTPETFTFGLALGPDATTDQVASALVGPGREVLLFLVSGSPVFEYEPDIYSDIEDGAMTAVLDASGVIDFPVLDDETEAATLATVRTIEDLRRAAAQPDASPIIVDVSGRRVSEG